MIFRRLEKVELMFMPLQKIDDSGKNLAVPALAEAA